MHGYAWRVRRAWSLNGMKWLRNHDHEVIFESVRDSILQIIICTLKRLPSLMTRYFDNREPVQ